MARNDSETPPSDDLGKPYEYDANFTGPLHRRSCTDIICLLIFAVFIFCWVFVAIFAFVKGNPETFTLPRDSTGSRCGYDAHVKDKEYLFFFDLSKCVSSTVAFTGCSTTQICVSQCPQRTLFPDQIDNSVDLSEYQKFCLGGTILRNVDELKKAIKDEKCPPLILKSTNVFNRCLYDVYDKKGKIISYKNNNRVNSINVDELKLIENFLQRANTWISFVVHYVIGIFTDNEYAHKVGSDIVDDIKAAWKEILGCILMGVFISILYIAVMRWIAGVMVWISLIGSLALLGFCVYYASDRYVYYKNHTTEHEFAKNYLDSIVKTQEFWLTLLIICSIVLIVLLLILLVLRKRITLAIALIEEGSKAVSAATSTLFFPIVPWIVQILIMAFFITIALYLSTTGSPIYKIKAFQDCSCTNAALNYKEGSECDPDIFAQYCKQTISTIFKSCSTATCSFVKMNNPIYVPYFHAVNVFGLFWLLFFASAFGEMVLASTFATWYWTKPKSKMPFFTLTAALFRTLRYHIGTLAFGSLLVAICRMIRVMLEYIDTKLKKYDNEITKAIMCCLKCCFYCLEKFIKFINRNAYIMCAIHGKNFCASAKDAFNLLMRNILRTFVLDKVVDFLFFLSKLLISIGIGCITYTILEYVSQTKINYTFVPAIFVAICIYLLTIVFFSVYTMAVDTLFLCYLEDSERNDGSAQKPYFMSSNLRKIFGHKNKRS